MIPFFGSRHPRDRVASAFRWLDPRPLPATRARFYSAGYQHGAYVLAMARSSYFAWEAFTEGTRYGDFALEADVELDPSNGHCAAGVVFRHVDDESFYSFLVSSRGNYRVDLLFNNHPMHLIEWTRLPEPGPEPGAGSPVRSLRVVGSGARFTFCVDDEWVGEMESDFLPAGSVGFAAQNFTGAERGIFRLRRIAVEARPVAVEREHLRWSYYAPVSPAARLRLAETFFAAGNVAAAAVQLRKALKDRDGSTRERFLLAQCLARLSLTAEALSEIERVLEKEPGHGEARREKANLLYLSGRLLDARDFLRDGLTTGAIPPDASMWNLLGNSEYGLGNWEKSADAYQRATALQPDIPLFLSNAARGLERAGRAAEAGALYLRAARLLFTEESFDELSLIMPRVRALAGQEPEVLAIEAKMLYREGRTEESYSLLRSLADAGSMDSAVHYLTGIILSARGERESALPAFARAAELEPEFPLYQFRLAETLHLLGRDPEAALRRALELAPEDPWTNNLQGQLLLQSADPGAAAPFLHRAHAAAPNEEEICLNLSEALSLGGRHEEALELLQGFSRGKEQSARMANQKGNVLVRRGDHQGAVREYEAAIRLDPENHVYKENCAAACVELDMVHRAEELLGQVEPEHPSASVYNLLGNVAVLKGERARAEAAYRAGLQREPGNPDVTVNLAQLQRDRGRHDEARDLLIAMLKIHPGHARGAALLKRIRDEREDRIECATCGREWWVPRELPPQQGIRVRGELPAEAPAGRCPTCARVYCVSCASQHLRDMRFFCPTCGELLKLSDDPLKWLLARYVESV